MGLEAILKRIAKQFEFASKMDFGVEVIEAWWQQQTKTKTTSIGWYLSVHFFSLIWYYFPKIICRHMSQRASISSWPDIWPDMQFANLSITILWLRAFWYFKCKLSEVYIVKFVFLNFLHITTIKHSMIQIKSVLLAHFSVLRNSTVGRLSRLLCFFLYLNRTRPSYVFTAL